MVIEWLAELVKSEELADKLKKSKTVECPKCYSRNVVDYLTLLKEGNWKLGSSYVISPVE